MIELSMGPEGGGVFEQKKLDLSETPPPPPGEGGEGGFRTNSYALIKMARYILNLV